MNRYVIVVIRCWFPQLSCTNNDDNEDADDCYDDVAVDDDVLRRIPLYHYRSAPKLIDSS